MLRSIFSGLFSFILSVVFLATFLSYTVLSTVLSPNFYSFVSDKIYDSTIKVLGTVIYESSPQLQKYSTKGQIEAGLKQSLTHDDLKETIESFVNQFSNPVFDEDGKAVVTFDYSNLLDKGLPSNIIANTNTSSIQVFQIDKEMFVSRDSLWKFFWLLILLQVFLAGIIALIVFKPWHKVLRAVSGPLLSASFFYGVLSYLGYRFFGNFEGKIVDTLYGNGSMLPGFEKSEMFVFTGFIKEFMWFVIKNGLVFLGIVFCVSFVVYIVGVWGKYRKPKVA